MHTQQEIHNYVKKVKMKRSLFGYRPTDVWTVIESIVRVYDELLEIERYAKERDGSTDKTAESTNSPRD